MSPKAVRRITCLGSGFVGGPTSAVTAFKTNVEVTVVDVNHARIQAWNSESLPIYEPGLHDIVHAVRDGISIDFTTQYEDLKSDIGRIHAANLRFSTDIDKAITEADLIFVCVNTPTKASGIGKGSASDLGFVEAATRTIAQVATGDKIVVEKSTVPCRTAQFIRDILSVNARPGVRFDVLSNPEFLAEGTAIRDLLHPDRIIIGSMSTESGHRAAASLADVYAQWVPRKRILTMNLWSAELSKLAANAMLAQRISSVNALSAICESTGADVDEVAHACGLDSRIGPHMLKAGPGFGGSCFQKDTCTIVYLSQSLHLHEVADYWRAIIKLNEYQKDRFTKRIFSCLYNNLTDKRVAVLGFAFKKDTSDTRESPAITLVTSFVAEKAHIAIYDPKVSKDQIWSELVSKDNKKEFLKQHISIHATAYEACAGADAVVVVTEWDEFSNKGTMISPIEDRFPDTARSQVSQQRSASPVIKTPIAGNIIESLRPATIHPASIANENTLNPSRSIRTTSFLQQHDEKHDEDYLLALKEINPNLDKSTSQNLRHGLGLKASLHSSSQSAHGSHDHGSESTFPRPTSTRAPVCNTHDGTKPQGPEIHGLQLPPSRLSVQSCSPCHSAVTIEKQLSAIHLRPSQSVRFRRLDWARVASGMRKPAFVFDGRNILDGEALEKLGFQYEAIGKMSKSRAFAE